MKTNRPGKGTRPRQKVIHAVYQPNCIYFTNHVLTRTSEQFILILNEKWKHARPTLLYGIRVGNVDNITKAI